MNNGILGYLAEIDYSFDEYFKDNKYANWDRLIGELSYMEGYIKGLEESNELLKNQLKHKD